MINPARKAPPLSYRGLFKWTLDILRYYRVKPRESLGQNFLVKPEIVFDVVSCLLENSCSRILEIGTGLGVLSYYLSSICGNMLGVEVDPVLAEISYNITRYVGGNIALGDGLDFLGSGRFHQLVSNTPYHLSAKIISKMARDNAIQSASLLVQKEVGNRITAPPGSKDYGRISIISQLFFDVNVMRVYPPTFFHPRPEVDGILLCFRRRKKWTRLHDDLEKVTGCIFSGRNKKAVKQVERCVELSRLELEWVQDKRVRELTPWDIEKILETVRLKGGYTRE